MTLTFHSMEVLCVEKNGNRHFSQNFDIFCKKNNWPQCQHLQMLKDESYVSRNETCCCVIEDDSGNYVTFPKLSINKKIEKE